MKIGSIIKTIREKKNIKQKDFATKCNISQTYLSQIENNKKTPTIELMNKMSDIFDVPVPVFLFLSLDETDVKEQKKELYRMMKPTLTNIIQEIYLFNYDS